MNGLPAIANNLAAKGRHGDSMLVHMNPKEVAGLQALAMSQGGSLSINPHTGLPEAFKLKQLLPTLLGIGASFLMPGVAPWMIGTGIGGIETLRTGDLGRGLMAGLGAYGGAGVGQALGAGAASAAPTAVGPQSIAPAGSATAGFKSALPELGVNVANAAPASVPSQASFLDKYIGAMGTPTKAFAGGLGMAAPFIPTTPMPTMPEPEKSNYAGPYVPSQRLVAYKDPNDKFTSEFSYFNPFNPVPGFQPLTAASGGSIASSDPNMNYDEGFALGGIAALAGGRFLEGPGDGTSDSIPATIANKQPARLADGEFVIDARTVSEIGNGSSKAGAKKLYAMMDRVHTARKKVGRGQDSRAEKYLPA